MRVEPATTAELASWLTSLDYVYAQDDLDAVAPYIARHYSVVAVRLAVDRPMSGKLAPLALTWAGTKLQLPLPGGVDNQSDPLTVYISGTGRYELPDANVTYAERTSSGEFITRNEILVDQAGSPDADPIATRIANDPEYVDITYVEEEIRVPVKDCSTDDDEVDHEDNDGGCGCGGCDDCSTQKKPRLDLLVIVAVMGLILRRRRR